MKRHEKSPTDHNNPFIYSRVECPVCKTLNEFETVRVDAYTESGRDADFCPTGINWRYPKYQSYNPLVFFAATCSNCFYSREFNNSFKNWKKDKAFNSNKLKTIREKHLEQLEHADSIIKKLGSYIDQANRPNESAIIKMHLVIYDEMLNEHYSSLDLGRWYLRIAWIYRDLGRFESPNINVLKSVMVEIENRYNHLRQTIESLQEQSGVFKKHLEAQFETAKISSELKSKMLPFKERFEEKIFSLEAVIASSIEQLKSTEQLLTEYKRATIGEDGSGDWNGSGSDKELSEFLSPLRLKWDGIVVTEREALGKATNYYKRAFEESREVEASNQRIQVSYLLAELSRRIGDIDQARVYFNSTIKHGQEFINHYREDKAQTALARKILELAVDQNKTMSVESEART